LRPFEVSASSYSSKIIKRKKEAGTCLLRPFDHQKRTRDEQPGVIKTAKEEIK
jgi:hypothetical protein